MKSVRTEVRIEVPILEAENHEVDFTKRGWLQYKYLILDALSIDGIYIDGNHIASMFQIRYNGAIANDASVAYEVLSAIEFEGVLPRLLDSLCAEGALVKHNIDDEKWYARGVRLDCVSREVGLQILSELPSRAFNTMANLRIPLERDDYNLCLLSDNDLRSINTLYNSNASSKPEAQSNSDLVTDDEWNAIVQTWGSTSDDNDVNENYYTPYSLSTNEFSESASLLERESADATVPLGLKVEYSKPEKYVSKSVWGKEATRQVHGVQSIEIKSRVRKLFLNFDGGEG